MANDILCSIDNFMNDYQPVMNSINPDSDLLVIAGEAGQPVRVGFKTSGAELAHVQQLHQTAPHRVWSVVEGCDCEYVIADMHSADKCTAYLITEKPWVTGNETFVDYFV